jgi:hypothetical protein
VFGVGVSYLLRMMRRLPTREEVEAPHIPQRAAGITPAPAIDVAPGTGGATHPAGSPGSGATGAGAGAAGVKGGEP